MEKCNKTIWKKGYAIGICKEPRISETGYCLKHEQAIARKAARQAKCKGCGGWHFGQCS